MPTLRDVTAIRSVQHDYYPTILITCLMNTNYDDPKPNFGATGFHPLVHPEPVASGLTDVISVNPPKVMEIDYTVAVWLYPGTIPDQTMLRSASNLASLSPTSIGSVMITRTPPCMPRATLWRASHRVGSIRRGRRDHPARLGGQGDDHHVRLAGRSCERHRHRRHHQPSRLEASLSRRRPGLSTRWPTLMASVCSAPTPRSSSISGTRTAISYSNLPYLGYAMGVLIWEEGWSESTQREWVARQFEFRESAWHAGRHRDGPALYGRRFRGAAGLHG